MATNSPDSLRNVNSDDLSSISSDSRSRSPTGKSLLERELESLREKAVARNVRDKYSGSGSFMSPEDAMAYISKQRKKTSNPTAPPSNLTSSAEISDWYMVQRQRELEERKKREEAEAYLRAYRGSAAYFIESPTQPPPVVASPTPITPVFSKDRKTSGSVSTPITPPMTNVTSPSKMESPKPVPSPENSKKNPNTNTVVVTATTAAAKPVEATLSAQSSIAQLDAYLKSVRGAAALQSKKSVSTTKGDPNSTTSTPSSTTQEKQTGQSPTVITTSIVETKAPSPPTSKTTVDGKVHETKSIAVITKSSPPPTPKVITDVKGNETKSMVETTKASPPSTKIIDSKIQDTKARPSPTTKVMNVESKQVDPMEETLPNQSTSKAKSNSPNTKGEIQTSSTVPTNIKPVHHSESTLISKLEAIQIAKDLPLDRKTIGSNHSFSFSNHPFDEDLQAHPPNLILRKTSEHRETQVDNSVLQQRGSTSLAIGQLDSFLRSVRGSVPSDDGKSPHTSVISSTQNDQPPMTSGIDPAPSSKVTAFPSQSSLTTSSISGDSLLIPPLEKKSSRVALKVDTQWNGRNFSHDSDDHYIDLLDEDAPESVQKHHGLNLSLVTPNVARNPKPPFSDLSKEISPNATTSPYRLESHASANMMKYSPVYRDGPTSSFEQGGDKRRYSEDIMGSRESMKSPLQLLDCESFQNDPADHLLVQDVDDEEDRFGSFQSGGKIVGRNIWTVPSDERSLDGGGSVMTSTSTSSKSISQNTEYRSSSSFQRLVQQQKEKYERRLKTRAEEHVEQIDEIIQQLNSIEVKYQSDISNLRASFTMKESNIVSLNALIVQARVKNAKLTDEATQQQAKNSAQRVEYDAVLKIQKDLEASIQGVQSEIKKTLAQREKLIAEAIRSAQEEIKIAAEKQFAQSNIAFIQLKKDLAVVDDEKKVWFKRAEEATSKLDDISSNSNRRIDDLARQVSKAREDLEFSKTDVSRTKQQLVHERTVFTERVESMTRDVSRLGKECAEAHQLAETIEQEKSQLKREANELKALSDELMSLVGG